MTSRPPPPFEELYDERTLAALDARTGEPARPWQPVARRGGAGGVLLGAVLGLREVLDPEPDDEPVIELRPDDSGADECWVTFVFVPGAPRASRILVRPWLAPAR